MIGTALLYLVARVEVSWALLTGQIRSIKRCGDSLPPELVPSVAAGNRNDRDLAEIDQNGIAFAVDSRDEELFNCRARMVPRRHHRIQIIFSGGVVRLRKCRLRKQQRSLRGRVLELLQFGFYLEAAALLRLRALPAVPAIWRINPREGSIEMDYIWGRDLRHILADYTDPINYDEVAREFAGLVANTENPASKRVVQLVIDTFRHGVLHRDLSAENFIRGHRSQQLYIVDFSLVQLRPVLGWRAHARQLKWLVGDGNEELA